MKRNIALIAVLVFVAAVTVLSMLILKNIPGTCQRYVGDTIPCEWIALSYVLVFAVTLIAFPIGMLFSPTPWRVFLGMAWTCLVFRYSLTQLMGDLSDIRTYSYEFFYLTLYMWLALFYSLFALALLLPAKRRVLMWMLLFTTFCATTVFALQGRGSYEQLFVLLGGRPDQFGFQAFSYSRLFALWTVLCCMVLASCLVIPAARWVKTGVADMPGVGRNVLLLLAAIAISSISFISLPVGIELGRNDVAAAREYIEEIMPRLKDYKEKHQAYPKTLIDTILEKDAYTPRLLDIFDYLAHNQKGAYFFSRAEKYCFLFMDPGQNFGYYAITSEKPTWAFSPFNGKSLEVAFLDLCGEPRPAEEILGEKMGIFPGDAGNPLYEGSNSDRVGNIKPERFNEEIAGEKLILEFMK